MKTALDNLKAELEGFGASHDTKTSEPYHRMFNITRDTGEFLGVMVRATAAQRVLEVGTSNGYSTIWLAEAACATGGAVNTVEFSKHKVSLATANFKRAGLSPHITQVHDDAGRFLRQCESGEYDLIFLDSERQEYLHWWPDLKRALRPGGIIIVDNALSHAEQMAPFTAHVQADSDFSSCLVAVGKGEFVAVQSI